MILECTETTVPLVSLPGTASEEVGVLDGRTRILVPGTTPGKLVLTVIPGRFGNFFLEVDAAAEPDRETVRRLAAKYDVDLLD